MSEIVGIKREFWIKLARSQLRRRLHFFGEKARVCDGCREILICDGPVSFQICKTVDNMVNEGTISVIHPKTTFKRIRSKFLPASSDCINAYKFWVENGKTRFKHKRRSKKLARREKEWDRRISVKLATTIKFFHES